MKRSKMRYGCSKLEYQFGEVLCVPRWVWDAGWRVWL